jgi:hypothetical protein
MFMVMVGEEWPNNSATTLGGSPSASISDAAMCRESCRRRVRRPVSLVSRWKLRLILSGLYGLPSYIAGVVKHQSGSGVQLTGSAYPAAPVFT